MSTMSDISVETFCPFGVLKADFPPQLYYTGNPLPPKQYWISCL